MKVKTTQALDMEVGQAYSIPTSAGPKEVYITEDVTSYDSEYVEVFGRNMTDNNDFDQLVKWDTECEDC